MDEHATVRTTSVLLPDFVVPSPTCMCLQEIPVHKLARGSRTDLLELLQYLYYYLLSE